jgi:hypothetical protein
VVSGVFREITRSGGTGKGSHDTRVFEQPAAQLNGALVHPERRGRLIELLLGDEFIAEHLLGAVEIGPAQFQ